MRNPHARQTTGGGDEPIRSAPSLRYYSMCGKNSHNAQTFEDD
ncbi:hypothetical protein K3495_g3486 [Podosphaera aphanis]|nr:hypothetical protein K3495_g3486 [Podosphaera aphanis]